jgi:ribonuclease HII
MSSPGCELERALWLAGQHRIVGVDEVGIGALCGPVVAAAVLLPAFCEPLAEVRDSKLMTADQRQRTYDQICRFAWSIGIGAASVAEIEQLNVRRASHLAMRRALRRIGAYDLALIDGNPIRDPAIGPHLTIVDGDATSFSIACASIVAKVTRDRLLNRLGRRFPSFGWERNAGYGTPEHLLALDLVGPTPYHRASFRPVQDAAQRESATQAC